MKWLYINLGKNMQCHIAKQLVHSLSDNIRISQSENSDVHLREHHYSQVDKS